MPIYWDQFDWPSFATLAAGIMAVGGATLVGLRQVAITKRQAGIAEKQNEILGRQALLAELTLKHELFDRRYVVFKVVRDVLSDILRAGLGRAPRRGPGRAERCVCRCLLILQFQRQSQADAAACRDNLSHLGFAAPPKPLCAARGDRPAAQSKDFRRPESAILAFPGPQLCDQLCR